MPSRLAWMGWLGLCTAVAACGVDTSLIFSETGTDGSGGSASTSTSGQGGDVTTSVSVVNSSVGVGGTPSTGGAGAGGDMRMCLPEEVVPTELRRLDMLVLFDRTGSTQSFLGQEKVQVQTFAQSAAAPWTRMSLLYHGGINSCSAMAYTPDIPMTPIPSQAQTIVNSLAPQQSDGGSPWEPPLEGGIDFATQLKMQSPDHQVVVAFIIDTQQTQCSADVMTQIVPTVTAGLNAGVKTYVIAINQAPVAQLGPIAMAGGTGTVIDLTGNQLSLLNSNLSAIRDAEIPCSIELPTPTTGKYDPEDVALRYGPGAGTPVDVPRVINSNDCIGDGEGWYFDDPVNPTTISLCPKTCGTIKVDLAPALEVAFTCPLME